MTIIYCIEDINDLKYIGSTNRNLNTRLTEHRYSKRNNRYGTSCKLNLEYCIIYELEKCDDKNREQREKYWINKIDNVNKVKYNFNLLEYRKKVYRETKDSLLYYHKNKKMIKEKRSKKYNNIV